MIIEQRNLVRLKINLDGGLNGDKQIIKSKTYGRITGEATAEGLYNAGVAIAALQDLPLLSILRLDDVALTQE